MNADFIKQVIEKDCSNYDIVVLKGFAPKLIVELGKTFSLVDDYAITKDKITLGKINESILMTSFFKNDYHSLPICTCESFINFCTFFSDLKIINKKICVLENNMLELYPNPTDSDIPDFDSEDFMNSEESNPPYSLYYSFCLCEDGTQKIQYIDNYSIFKNHVFVKQLITPKPYKIKGEVSNTDGLRVISTKDGSLATEMSHLYDSLSLKSENYAIQQEDIEDNQIKVFVQACHLLNKKINIYKIGDDIPLKPRKELSKILNNIWEYTTFRNLKLYKNLNVNHDVTEISQGAIIETVIQQAESAYKEDSNNCKNVLLTSPTGAGKSLLFQLSAIYLAEKYGLLTIVISPLVALMNDQVEGLQKYSAVATLNSNKTAKEKETILNGVKEGTINILYLSPELLLSYSITMFLGERRLGLLVVDEAHTVTTWGRDFRVDYWFLGDYIRKAKRILHYKFPIFALTATAVWDPSGKNDMVFDTIRSLNMDPCIKFIGVVRRSNIRFEIEQSNIDKKYEENRKKKTIERIREAIQKGRKTIVYFPFKSTVDSIYFSEDISDIKDKITRFHAGLFPAEKISNTADFRNGEKQIMCATKAFGMGIDVSDIQEVYHHAPTGCLSDYVQEIGRLARDPKITGIAKIDFSTNDHRYVRKLHGLSAIKPYQISSVLRKLIALYKINGEKRNMLISSSDFKYIFPLSTTPEDLDQSLKSCLLLISNDLLNKLRFQSIIVRPKSIFSKCYIEVPLKEKKDFNRINHNYLKLVKDCIYHFDADKYWTEKNNSISFPQFKFKLQEGSIFKDFHIKLMNKVSIVLNYSIDEIKESINNFFEISNKILTDMSETHHRIKFEKIKSLLPKDYDSEMCERFIETFRLLYVTSTKLGGNTPFCNIITSNKNEDYSNEFQLIQGGFEKVSSVYTSTYNKFIHKQDITEYCDETNPIVELSEFLNSLGLADYQRVGGDQPLIFVRINNPNYLEMLVKSKRYENTILKNIYEKYTYSEKIFTYFFTTKMTDEQRWDFIEEYFLGANEERLLNFV